MSVSDPSIFHFVGQLAQSAEGMAQRGLSDTPFANAKQGLADA